MFQYSERHDNVEAIYKNSKSVAYLRPHHLVKELHRIVNEAPVSRRPAPTSRRASMT